MEIVPLQVVPNQAVLTSLNGQTVQLNVYQKRTGLFLDIYVSNTLILAGVRCRNTTLMVLDAYLGFVGALTWLDNQGNDNPDYTGLWKPLQPCLSFAQRLYRRTTSIPPLSRYT